MKYRAKFVLEGPVKKPMKYLRTGDVIELVNNKGFTFKITSDDFKWNGELAYMTDRMGIVKAKELERVQ